MVTAVNWNILNIEDWNLDPFSKINITIYEAIECLSNVSNTYLILIIFIFEFNKY